jgi:myo-inositol 2-dehydrogenase/D-chiro-inositol 1-dehydrogenase
VVATPTDTHYEIVMAALQRRLAIFCEKPLDLRIDRLRVIQADVERQHANLMVAFQRRFDPQFAAMKRDIEGGRIGTPRTIRTVSRDSRLPPEDFIPRSGGIFMDMSVHDFDMSRFLLGREIEEVHAQVSRLIDPMFERHGDWDSALVTLRFEGGALGVIENSRLASFGYDQRIEVFGSSGMLRVENPPSALRSGTGEAPFFAERYADAYRLEVQAFVDALRGGAPMPVDVVASIRAVEAALAARQSVADGRSVKIEEIRSQV